jgi:hypothetical protein
MVTVTFEFVHPPDASTFRASASDARVIARVRAELAKPFKQRSLHINGKISAGTGDNAPWSWHFDQDKWDVVETSIELCDARPSYVEENLEQWLKDVGRFCPWQSRVSKEL